MKVNINICIFFVCLLTISTQSFCQVYSTTFYHFKLYAQKDGLSSYYVKKVVQDRYGFIWVATQDGLDRFDGKSFVPYNKFADKEAHKILQSDVTDITIDSVSNMLWVSTSLGGINGIDLLEGKVKQTFVLGDLHLPSDWIISMKAVNEKLWIGTNDGIAVYDTKHKQTLRFERLPFAAKPGLPARITAFELTSRKTLLALLPSYGVAEYDTRTHQLLNFFDVSKFGGNDVRLNDITVNAGDSILIATSKGVKIIYNNKVGDLPATDHLSVLKNENFLLFRSDASDRYWAVTANKLLVISPNIQQYDEVSNTNIKSEQDWYSLIEHLFFDSNGDIWVASRHGLLYARNSESAFRSFMQKKNNKPLIQHVYSIYPLTAETTYIAGLDGVYKVNAKTHAVLDKVECQAIRKLGNRLFFFSNNGIKVLSEQDQLIPASTFFKELRSIQTELIQSAIEFSDSIYLLGSYVNKGIWIWDTKKHTVVYCMPIEKDNPQATIQINKIYKDSKNRVWVVSINGIYLLDIVTQRFTRVDFNIKGDKPVYFDICEKDSYFWIATYGSGILVADTAYHVIKQINTVNGLTNNAAYKILPAQNHYVFVTTNYGISRVHTQNFSISNYYEEDGLNSSNFESNSVAVYQNILYVGGLDGFTAIHPHLLFDNRRRPRTFITGIKIRTETGEYDTSNLNIQKLNIPSNVLQTTMMLSAINYINPERTTFSYMIRELNSNWIKLDKQSFIDLIGLAPGTYHLQIRAANEEGVHSQPVEIELVYLPKWHQTWLFKTMVVLLVTLLLYGLYRYRVRQIIKVEHIRQKLSSDLHDDIGSTLNSVNLFTKMAILQPENKEYLPQINEGVQSAITGVRDIIWILDKEPETISNMFNRIRSFAGPAANAAGCQLVVNMDMPLEHHTLAGQEKRNVYLVIKEAINNAVKYAQCDEIVLRAEKAGKELVVSITDNGQGFESGNNDFSRIDGGNGLKNMKLRCDEIKWKLSINSEKGKGCSIKMHTKIKD